MLFSSPLSRRTANGARPRCQGEASSATRQLPQHNRTIAVEAIADPLERAAVEQASVRCAQEYLRRRAQGREPGKLLPLEWDGFFLSVRTRSSRPSLHDGEFTSKPLQGKEQVRSNAPGEPIRSGAFFLGDRASADALEWPRVARTLRPLACCRPL